MTLTEIMFAAQELGHRAARDAAAAQHSATLAIAARDWDMATAFLDQADRNLAVAREADDMFDSLLAGRWPKSMAE